MTQPPFPPGDGPPPLPHRPATGPLPVQPLAYAGRGAYVQKPKPRTPFVGRVALGCLGYVLLTAGWFALGAAAQQLQPVAFTGWVVMTVALLGLSLFIRIKYGFSGVGYGILMALLAGVLIVVGLVALLIGLCFREMNKQKGGTTVTPVYPTAPAPSTEPTTLPDETPATQPAGAEPGAVAAPSDPGTREARSTNRPGLRASQRRAVALALKPTR